MKSKQSSHLCDICVHRALGSRKQRHCYLELFRYTALYSEIFSFPVFHLFSSSCGYSISEIPL